LSRIVTNVFLDEVRRKKRRPLEALPADSERLLPASPSADEPVDRLPDDVQAALRSLPEDFRAAVVLCDVVGLSYEEIGDALDIPVGTVRSRIHRGRRMLRDMLR
jgi:RNA polymerase sigma-70 factor (ECF subfamily)